MAEATLADRILMKCTACGDCLLWKGAWASEGTTPSIWFDGSSVNVRSAMWREAGRFKRRSEAIKPQCGEPSCVALEHQKAVKYRVGPKSAMAKAATAKAMRSRSPLTEEVAEQIRGSDEPLTEWARRLGVSLQTVSGIRHFRRWAPAVTPFSGLGARA